MVVAYSKKMVKLTLIKRHNGLCVFPRRFFEEKSSGVLLRGEVEDLSWVAQKLAGLGMPFIIHRPQELRVVMSQYAQKLANYAQQINTEGIEPE